MHNEYRNYYEYHIWYKNQNNNSYLINYYKKNLKELFSKPNVNKLKVLEIWCWKWVFSQYCESIWIKEYYWFDLDENIILENNKTFLNNKWFIFSSDNVIDFLNSNKDFDIIFMSHVFEHLDSDESKMYINKIYKSLIKNWVYINIMPNAWSLFSSTIQRYSDNTHKTLYTDNSFNQVLLWWWFIFENIKHKNSKSWPILLRYIRIIIKYIIKLFIKFMWYSTSNIDTLEMITFAKK